MRNYNSSKTNHIDANIIKYIDQVLLQSRSLNYMGQDTTFVQNSSQMKQLRVILPIGQIEKTQKMFNNGNLVLNNQLNQSPRIKSNHEEQIKQIIRQKNIKDEHIDYKSNYQYRQQQRKQLSNHINSVKILTESLQKQNQEDLDLYNENSYQTNRIYEEIDKQKKLGVQIKANEIINCSQYQIDSQNDWKKLELKICTQQQSLSQVNERNKQDIKGQLQYLTQRRFTPNFNNGLNLKNERRLKPNYDIQSCDLISLNSQNLESSQNFLQFQNNTLKTNIMSTQTSLEKIKPLDSIYSANSPIRPKTLSSFIKPVVDTRINTIQCNDSPIIKFIKIASPIKMTNQQFNQNDNYEFQGPLQNNSIIKSQNNIEILKQKINIQKTGTNHVVMKSENKQKNNLPSQNPQSQIQKIQTIKKPESRFQGFSIDHLLGSGKFSEVYLATHQSSGLKVALKVISKAVINESGMSKQLSEEIKIQYLLPHDNIVKLYTFFQNQNEVVLVLEYCPDGCLYSQLQKQNNAKFTEKQAAIYIKQVAASLVFLHSKSVIHRDIKPENILLSFGQIKLADFSFSVYSPQKKRQTQCGSVVYQSPEIVNGVQYDYKTDVWALGVLAFELCHGQTPWENLEREQAFSEIKKASIIFPNYFSTNLKQFIESLTRKDPSIRLSACESMFHPWLQNVNGEIISSKLRDIKRKLI